MSLCMPGTAIRDAELSERRRSGVLKETALWLVNPVEYATAERLYDGDSYLIACELGVTVQVIEDYKSLLASRSTAAYEERTVE